MASAARDAAEQRQPERSPESEQAPDIVVRSLDALRSEVQRILEHAEARAMEIEHAEEEFDRLTREFIEALGDRDLSSEQLAAISESAELVRRARMYLARLHVRADATVDDAAEAQGAAGGEDLPLLAGDDLAEVSAEIPIGRERDAGIDEIFEDGDILRLRPVDVPEAVRADATVDDAPRAQGPAVEPMGVPEGDTGDIGATFAFAGDAARTERGSYEPELVSRAVAGEAEVPPPSMSEEDQRDEILAVSSRARRLVNVAKLKSAGGWSDDGAYRDAVLAETDGVLENDEIREQMFPLLRAMSEGSGSNDAIERIANALRVPKDAVDSVVQASRNSLQVRAREEVERERRGGVKRALAGAAGYAGLAMTLEYILPGLGSATALLRMYRTRQQGREVDRAVATRTSALRTAVGRGIAEDGTATGIATDVMRDIAANLAIAKQRMIDGVTEPEHISAERIRMEAEQYLTDGMHCSPEVRARLAAAAAGIFAQEQAQQGMEEREEARRPGAFGKFMAGMERVFTSNALRGGATTEERMLTTAVFAGAGILARGIPVVRNILMGYAGLKAGELAAGWATKHAGRYEVLQPVNLQALQGDTVSGELLARARTQLMDRTYRAAKPGEWQQLRELVDQHEARMLALAEDVASAVQERQDALVKTLADRRGKTVERAAVVNAARLAGAAAGAIFGPDVVVAIAERLRDVAGHVIEYVGVGASAGTPTPAARVEAVPPEPRAPAPVRGGGVVEEVPRATAVPRAAEGGAPPEHREGGASPAVTEVPSTTDAVFRPKEGITHTLLRQLTADPAAYGFDGDIEDEQEVARWALARAKDIAIREGFLDADRVTTTHGIRIPEGATVRIELNHDGSVTYVGGTKEELMRSYHHVAGEAAEAPSRAAEEDVVRRTPDALRGAFVRERLRVLRDAFEALQRGIDSVQGDTDEFRSAFVQAREQLGELERAARALPSTMVREELARVRAWLDAHAYMVPEDTVASGGGAGGVPDVAAGGGAPGGADAAPLVEPESSASAADAGGGFAGPVIPPLPPPEVVLEVDDAPPPDTTAPTEGLSPPPEEEPEPASQQPTPEEEHRALPPKTPDEFAAAGVEERASIMKRVTNLPFSFAEKLSMLHEYFLEDRQVTKIVVDGKDILVRNMGGDISWKVGTASLWNPVRNEGALVRFARLFESAS